MAAYDFLNQKSNYASFGSALDNIDQNNMDDQISNNLSLQNYASAQLQSQLAIPGSFGEIAFGGYELLGQGKELFKRFSAVKDDIQKLPDAAKALLEKGGNKLGARVEELKSLATGTKGDLEQTLLDTKENLTKTLVNGSDTIKSGINKTIETGQQGLNDVLSEGQKGADNLLKTGENVISEGKQNLDEFTSTPKLSFLQGGAGAEEDIIGVAPKPVQLPQGPVETGPPSTRQRATNIARQNELDEYKSTDALERPIVSRTITTRAPTTDIGRSQSLMEVSDEFPLHEQLSGLTTGTDFSVFSETSVNKIVMSAGTDNPFASLAKTKAASFGGDIDYSTIIGSGKASLGGLGVPVMPGLPEVPKIPELPPMPELPAVPKIPSITPVVEQAKSAAQDFLNTGQNAASNVKTTLNSVVESIKTTGTDVFNSAAQGLERGGAVVKNAISSAADIGKGALGDLADLGEEAASIAVPILGEGVGLALGVTQLYEGFKDLFDHPSAAPPVTVPIPQIARISQSFQSGI
jgi:hypothetical protein